MTEFAWYWATVGREHAKVLLDEAAQFIAWRLPRRLAYWCAVRVVVHAAVNCADEEMDALSPSDVLKAWDATPEERS